MKKRITLILFAICFAWITKSQNFNYQLVKDSSVYSSLTSSTTIAANNDWKNKSFGLKLPFQFNICGQSSDSIIIESNGYIEFANAQSISLIAFNNFTSNKDTNNLFNSLISYEVSGSAGNKIFKIQFLNLSQNKLSNEDNLSYQIWLFQNGNKIELHIGSSSFSNPENEMPVLFGIINRNMDLEGTNAFMVSGNPSQPSSRSYTIESDELGTLNFVPYQGTVYRLTPSY